MYQHTYDDAYLKKEDNGSHPLVKKMLPASSLNRLKEVFNALDAGEKGYLVFEDFKKNYRLGYTITEIENIFQRLDKEGNRRIYIYEFAHLLLPEDFTI